MGSTRIADTTCWPLTSKCAVGPVHQPTSTHLSHWEWKSKPPRSKLRGIVSGKVHIGGCRPQTPAGHSSPQQAGGHPGRLSELPPGQALREPGHVPRLCFWDCNFSLLDNTVNLLYNLHVQKEAEEEVCYVPEGEDHADAAFRGHGRSS